MERSASGRRGVEADEVRAGEVRPLHNSIEADEQTWATGGGGGGAKGEDRGKHRRATHVPDTAPDKRVPEARLCTRSCSWKSSVTTRGGSPVRELRPPGSVRGASSNGCPYPDSHCLAQFGYISRCKSQRFRRARAARMKAIGDRELEIGLAIRGHLPSMA